jgi:hypothetical protein
MFFLDFMIVMLATFGASSAWLYSPGFESLRCWWVSNTGALAPLAYCQLCCSFWFALVIIFFAMGWNTIIWHVIGALSCAGVSWMLGAITNYFLWGKVNFEKEYNDQWKQ